ncbi:hypothetical protein METSCH_B06140 [Metschnikowia aff. pulcherrima]|uniref:Uncharacterized protein n=1 Tax=Metschnikowia aff. pulcherrima TaxID=2163413 RepID=A0A4P6XJE0_9ASCO|nr:hypothetical protein METSCH_B06140 [Metschnikowia aff. pulcherrima]
MLTYFTMMVLHLTVVVRALETGRNNSYHETESKTRSPRSVGTVEISSVQNDDESHTFLGKLYSKRTDTLPGKDGDDADSENHIANLFKVAMESEVEYLTDSFQNTLQRLESLRRDKGAHNDDKSARFTLILQDFEDAYLEKMLAQVDAPVNEASKQLDKLVKNLIEKLYDTSLANKYPTSAKTNEFDHLTKECTSPLGHSLVELAQGVAAAEKKLQDLILQGKQSQSWPAESKNTLRAVVRILQSQISNMRLEDSSEVYEIKLRMKVLADIQNWYSQTGLHPRPLFRADSILADRIYTKLHAVEKCLRFLKKGKDADKLELLHAQAHKLARDIFSYDFSSGPLIDLLLRCIHNTHTSLEDLSEDLPSSKSCLLFETLALKALKNNFLRVQVQLKNLQNDQTCPIIRKVRVECLNTEMKIWVCDLQQWNFRPSQELSDLHILGHQVADALILARKKSRTSVHSER